MRLLLVAGILLVLGGAYALLEGGVVTSRRDVIDVGGLKVSTEQQRPIRPWVAGAALVLGGALIVAGVTRKS